MRTNQNVRNNLVAPINFAFSICVLINLLPISSLSVKIFCLDNHSNYPSTLNNATLLEIVNAMKNSQSNGVISLTFSIDAQFVKSSMQSLVELASTLRDDSRFMINFNFDVSTLDIPNDVRDILNMVNLYNTRNNLLSLYPEHTSEIKRKLDELNIPLPASFKFKVPLLQSLAALSVIKNKAPISDNMSYRILRTLDEMQNGYKRFLQNFAKLSR